MSIEAPELPAMSVGEDRLAAVSFAGKLDSGVLLTGTPTVTEATGTLTLSSKAVSTGNLTINNETVLTGQAVQFLVDAGNATAGTVYTIRIACATDSTPAETVRGRVRVRVVAD